MRILRSTSVQKKARPMPSLPRASNLEQSLPQAIRQRHAQIGAKGTHALGDPGIVGANADRPSADRFLDFSAVVEDFPVHVAILAYLRRCVQLRTASVTLERLTINVTYACGPITLAPHVSEMDMVV